MKTKYILILTVLAILGACKPNVDEFAPSKGTADFTTYIAVGDSWTAGFADASLYKSGQENSFPNILATQFNFIGGGTLKQPLMLDDYGLGLGTGNPEPKLVLDYVQDCMGAISLAPVYADVAVNMENFIPIGAEGPFHNIGIPALKSFHMAVPGYALLNPYYGRFATNGEGTVMDEIPRVDADFFTLWLGIYDLIGYAILGGEGDSPTDATTFGLSVGGTLAMLTANGAKGAVANIPEVLDAPFFNTIPYNGLVLSSQVQVDQLNAGYATLNTIIKMNGSDDTIHFALGANPFVIQDASLAWARRQIHSGELILMSTPQDSLKCGFWGTQDPIPEYYTLDATEIENIQTSIADYNEVINGLVLDKPVVLVDMNTALKSLRSGVVIDGVTLDNRLVQGNFYSLDGLHPTPMGYALVANYFIMAINQGFNASIPLSVVSDYPAVLFP